MGPPLPECVTRLLWDVDAAAIDPDRDALLILERVMSRGDWESMKWLRASYPREALADFVLHHGASRLSPRDVAYWAAVSGIEVATGPGGGRPPWAG